MSESKQVIIPSDPVSREKIKKNIVDISNTMAIIEGHRAVIKETIDAVAEEFELPKKFVRKMASAYHKQNIKSQTSEFVDFHKLYGAVIEKVEAPADDEDDQED